MAGIPALMKLQTDRQNLDKYNFMNRKYWDSASNIDSWIEKNKSHPIVQKMLSDPEVSRQRNLYQGPMGQMGKSIAPFLGDQFRNPEFFARMINIPGIKELFQNTLGQAGAPGLAMAHSFMGGDMSNWRTLTAGLWDPARRVKKADTVAQYLDMREHYSSKDG
jgi:hypothetical protein